MYIKFDLSGVDHNIISEWIDHWGHAHGISYTKKVIRNHRRQELRVCFRESTDYAFFAMAWPSHMPAFGLENTHDQQD